MQGTLRVRTTILPGKRLEITDPKLREGERVEVIVVLPEERRRGGRSMAELIDSLPPGPRAFPTWEEYERRLEEERAAGDGRSSSPCSSTG